MTMSDAEETVQTAQDASGSSTIDATPQPARRSRAVSNLSQQQIQQKRDQDRKAQRALRERNRNKVESLEDALVRLTASHAEEMTARDDRLRMLQEENERLRCQFELGSSNQCHNNTVAPPTSRISRVTAAMHDQSQRVGVEQASSQSPIPSRLSNDPVTQAPTADRISSPGITSVGAPSSHDAVTPPISYSLAGLEADLQSPGLRFLPPPSDTMTDAARETRMPGTVYSALPQHLPPTNPLDHILLGFLKYYGTTTSGDLAQFLAGPARVSLKSYLHPELSEGINPISRLLNEVLATFSHVRGPEKISFMYLMHRTMRVRIGPPCPL